MLLVLLLVWPGLTTRLVPGPATISLDGGYRDILVTIQPRICREGRGQKACARQTLGNLKVGKFPQKCCDTSHTDWSLISPYLLLHHHNFVVITLN